MALFKCKMCGGSLEINNETVVTCEYCGTQQTLPKLDDDKRANMYDRANHFRRNNEFDKAMGIYEQILNEDNTDAEAYWSLVLCRYGIEYVEDPASHKRIPTVNRAQFTSVFDDEDYKSALQYADVNQRTIYEEEAKVINEIQKGILEISQKEEPFDVFICYKESDNSGRRTPDSVLAQDLYYQLKEEGFKVFFARITLEDKLGSAYEPYIFAALNSSKVMVVLGTKPEFFNAVWVKNEWSRYLALIKQGQKKMLIPAYKDMDPYDLPEEFSHLQAQDMSKLGFMQDLIRGIKKIVKSDEPKQTVVKETVIASGNTNIVPLLERAFMFLEDGDWSSADEYCEKVLDLDPKCARAYLGKLMSELRIHTENALRDYSDPFDDYDNYQKVMRFGDDALRAKLESDIEYINTRNENARLDGIYTRAKNAMSSANTESEYKDAAQLFKSVSEYLDSAALAQTCYEKAEIVRKDVIYLEGKHLMSAGEISSYKKAIQIFESIKEWKDAKGLIDICQKKIEDLTAKAEAEKKEAECRAEEARIEAERIAKRNKKIAVITTPIVCVIVAFIIVLNAVIIPNSKYNDAIALMDAGKYSEAILAFDAMDGYKDSKVKITECATAIETAKLDSKYNEALSLMEAGKYEEAIKAFVEMNGYKDSRNKITEIRAIINDLKYNDAISLMNAGNFVEAYEIFIALDVYKDSANKAESIYDKYKVAKLKGAKVGDCVFFGSYEQDNKTSNGKEDIEWRVLEVKDGNVLVISKYALDYKEYKENFNKTTWETCSLRDWLNNEFLKTAFDDSERTMILTTSVSADKNPKYEINPGNPTQDKVFLLSIIEADKYFTSDSDRECISTDYALDKGNYSSFCWWWLRTPGQSQYSAAFVNYDGDIVKCGPNVINSSYYVRPALWIDLS